MIGIFGGTFDPIHLGHLSLAQTVYDHFQLQRVIFVPLGTPPHRDLPEESSQTRVKLLRAGIAGHTGFEISTVEVDKVSPSWTVETLAHFSRALPDETLCLLMGSDAFRPINQWYQWKSLLNYCHLIVVSRAGDEEGLETEVADYLAQHRVTSLKENIDSGGGDIYWLEADIADISSTQVRHCLSVGEPLSALLPATVESLIKENGYYGYK